MDAQRFDRLASALASRFSRRTAVKNGLGLGAVALGTSGLALHHSAVAQEASPVGSPPDACISLSEAENVAVARRWYEEALNERNFDVIDEIVAADGRHDLIFYPETPNPEGIKQVLGDVLDAFPDVRFTVEESLSDGDLVVLRWLATGTFAAAYHGVPPSGEPASWSGINMFRFACGQIVEAWAEVDTLSQVGLNLVIDDSAIATPGAEATPAADCAPGSEAANADIAVQWFEVWNSGELSLYESLVSPDTIHHFGMHADAVGAKALQDGVQSFLTAFPDLVHSNDEVIADGNLVAVRFTQTGTFTGPFLGAEPTGEPISVTGISIFRVECGVVAESWSEEGGFALWRQLGIIEATATPAP